jgi:hypothetical protein
MNLDEFIAQALEKRMRNAYVDEPGFDTLYVRVATRFLDDQQLQTIDLATIGASVPGESVQTERFRNKLRTMGFVERPYEPYNFYLVPRKME